MARLNGSSELLEVVAGVRIRISGEPKLLRGPAGENAHHVSSIGECDEKIFVLVVFDFLEEGFERL